MEQIDIDSQSSRMPVILLVDNSALMGTEGKIDLLNDALIGFKKNIEEDETLNRLMEVCVIAFGNRITVLHDFSSIKDFIPPVLQANGSSLMGAGILKALAMLESRKLFYKKNAVEYFTPKIYLFCGSEPDDFPHTNFDGCKTWNDIRDLLKNDIYYKRYLFIPFVVIPEKFSRAISICDGETTIKYGEHDKTIYENGGEIRTVLSEDEAKNISIDSTTIKNANLTDKTTGENYQISYFRIINTLFPLEVPIAILGNQTNYKELFSRCVTWDDEPQEKDARERPVTITSPDQCEITADDSIKEIEKSQLEESNKSPVTLLSVSSCAEVTFEDIKEVRKKNILNILSASMIGPLHIIKGIPCQDAYAYEKLSSGHTIITIADGLGSASMSEIGSRIAVNAAVEAIKNKTSDEIKSNSMCNLIKDSVIAARKALEEKSLVLQCTLRDLACTFISLLIHEDSLVIAHIGDGAVVARTKNDMFVASEPGNSEYANEVTPLTSKNWDESLRITPIYEGILQIMAFSDGLQRAALRNSEDRKIPYKAFCEPLFLFAEEITNLQDGAEELKEFLSSKKISDHSEDDKTLIFVTIKNIHD